MGYLLRLTAYIPALGAVLAILIRLIKSVICLARRHSGKGLSSETILPAAAALVLAAACAWVICGFPAPPARLIPGAWSNLGFFGETLSVWAASLRIWLANTSATDINLLSRALASVIMILLSVLLMMPMIVKPRITSFTSLIIYTFAAVVIMFVLPYSMGTGNGLGLAASCVPVLLAFADYGFMYVLEDSEK
jgi:hypothetical protein